MNVLNPKLTLFFFAFLPQFLDASPGLLGVRLIGLGGIFMLMTLAVFAVYAVASAACRDLVLAAPVGLRVDRTGVRCHPDRIRRQTSVHRSVIRTGRTCTKVRAKDRPHARGATLLPVARYGHTRQARVAPPLTDRDIAS